MSKRDEAMRAACVEIGKAFGKAFARQTMNVPAVAEQIIAAYEAHMRPEVTSVEELDALPNGTVIKSLLGGREPAGRTWAKLEGEWWGMALDWGIASPALPARVIHWGAE